MERHKLEDLLEPESIAVVGASPDSRYSGNLIENLLEYGFDGTLYPVNPNRDEAFDRKCFDSLSDLPESPDLAVVSIPREYVVETVEEAGEEGIDAVLVITAGFSESDERGKELEKKLQEVAEDEGIALSGPNTIGFANASDSVTASAICSREPREGSISLLSQSGALAFATFFDRAKDRDVNFSKIIATGNETGLSMTDYVDYLAEDPETDVIAAYIEGIDDPRSFGNACLKAEKNGKKVLAVKTGKHETASKASELHTGAISGPSDAWNALFERTGVERVEDIPDLLGRAKAHASQPSTDRDICITSTSGGLAGLLADMAEERDLNLPPVEGETEQNLLDMDELLTFGEMRNPADIRQQGTEAYRKIADTLYQDEKFSAYVFAVALPAVGEQAQMIADKMIAVDEMTDQPVFFLWTGRKEADVDDPAYERARKNVNLYYDAARCMDAVDSVLGKQETGEEIEEDISVTEGRTQILSWDDTRDRLPEEIPLVDHEIVQTPDEALEFASDTEGSVVIKSANESHRTEKGLVSTGLRSGEIVEETERILEESDGDSLVVQEQIEGLELLVSLRHDEMYGPVVTVAPGGVHTEAYSEHEVTFLAPVTASEVKRRLKDTMIEQLLTGRKDLDYKSFVSLVEAVATLNEDSHLSSLEINPVMVTEDGAQCVDLLAEE